MIDDLYLSEPMVSNILTMTICAEKDKRQAVGEPYSIPSEEIRLLRAKLILEEAFETIWALGFTVINHAPIEPSGKPPNLEKIIDGVCDLTYVALGTLVSCGVPDVEHMNEVCKANERKLPFGMAIFNDAGKFLKPVGWKGPDHVSIMKIMLEKTTSVKQFSEGHIRKVINHLRKAGK